MGDRILLEQFVVVELEFKEQVVSKQLVTVSRSKQVEVTVSRSKQVEVEEEEDNIDREDFTTN